MPELYFMTQGHRYWQETLSLAQHCSWKAGPYLASKMRNNDFTEAERVCVARIDGKPAGFCTFSEKDELPEGHQFTPFIGFLFVREQYRGNRLSEWMIQNVIAYARKLGYDKIYILSGEIGLYEKYGFQNLGVFQTVHGCADQLFVKSTAELPLASDPCDT